jgi:hypothetical protein
MLLYNCVLSFKTRVIYGISRASIAEKPVNRGSPKRKASLLRIHAGFSDRWLNATMVFEDREACRNPYNIN